MTAADLIPLFKALNQLNLFAVLQLGILCMLCLIELVRLVIVVKRSVKGRMDNV